MQSFKRTQKREGIDPARKAHSINIQHVIIMCFLYAGLENLTDRGEKDKVTDHLDSVMSSDDYNMAIRAGSLEKEAHELQAWKVWRASEQTSMGCNWISLYQPHPLEEREIRGC